MTRPPPTSRPGPSHPFPRPPGAPNARRGHAHADRLHSRQPDDAAMPPPSRPQPRLHAVPADLPGLPCGAAALAALTGLPVHSCVRVLEDHHGYFPLDSVVIPPTLDALAALGWRHRAARPDAAMPFGDWARRAEPGLHLVSLPGHVIAADVRRAPPVPRDDHRLQRLPARRRAAYCQWLAGGLRAACAPRAYRAHRAALLDALGVDVGEPPPNAVLVVDNGHLCTRIPAPPPPALHPLPVDESARIAPATRRR